MSTRCNVILTDNTKNPSKKDLLDATRSVVRDFLILYHHSDGYPSNMMPMLQEFVGWIGTRIRNVASQSVGWLIFMEKSSEDKPGNDINMYGWKASEFEPTTQIHGDIEYLYIVNMAKKTITVYTPVFDDDYNIKDFKRLSHWS